MLNVSNPAMRFQGISVIKHTDMANDYMGVTTEGDDRNLLQVLELILNEREGNSRRASSSIAYRLPGDQFLEIMHMDNGVEVYYATPAVRKAGGALGPKGDLGSYSHPYIYLTYETITPSLHDSLRRVQGFLYDKLGLDRYKTPDNGPQLTALSQAIENLRGLIFDQKST